MYTLGQVYNTTQYELCGVTYVQHRNRLSEFVLDEKCDPLHHYCEPAFRLKTKPPTKYMQCK